MKLFLSSSLCLLFLFISCVSPTHLKNIRGEGAPKNVLLPLWEKPLVIGARFAPVPEQFSSPVFNDNGKIIYVSTSKGAVYAITTTQKTLWKIKVKGSFQSRPLYVKSVNLLVVGTIGGMLYGINPKIGKIIWKFHGFGSFLAGFAYKNGVVYATTSKNMLYAITSDSGELHWSKRTETIDGFSVKGHASPVLNNNMIFTGLSDGRIFAQNISKRGQLIWTKTLENPENENYIDADTDPVIDGDTMYTSTYRNGVVAMEVSTGDLLWKYPAYGVTSVTIHKNRIYFVSPRDGVFCLTLSGRLVWRQSVEYGTPHKIIIRGRRMFIPFDLGGILVMDPDTGFFLQRFDTGKGISSNLAFSNNKIAAMSNNGKLYLFSIR